MKIEGIEEFSNLIETIKRNFKTETTQFLKMKVNEVKRDTKINTPVDTGTLRNGWHHTKSSDFKQIIYNNVDYADKVEFGHMNRGDKSYQLGRYMLTKAVKKQESKFYTDLNNVFRKVLDK